MPPANCGCVLMEVLVLPETSVSAMNSRFRNACVTVLPWPGFCADEDVYISDSFFSSAE